MIRKRVQETVPKTGEQQLYEADDRAQAKTRCETACLTCQYDKGCTQGIGLDCSGSETIPSPVCVLSQRERGILQPQIMVIKGCKENAV